MNPNHLAIKSGGSPPPRLRDAIACTTYPPHRSAVMSGARTGSTSSSAGATEQTKPLVGRTTSSIAKIPTEKKPPIGTFSAARGRANTRALAAPAVEGEATEHPWAERDRRGRHSTRLAGVRTGFRVTRSRFLSASGRWRDGWRAPQRKGKRRGGQKPISTAPQDVTGKGRSRLSHVSFCKRSPSATFAEPVNLAPLGSRLKT